MNDSPQSVGELTRDLSEQTAVLVRKEMALAVAEMKQKGRHAGLGAGLFGGSGALALYGLGALVAAAILGLGELISGWLAALLVATALFAIAGISALVGKRQIEQATPANPEQARESVGEDVEAIKRAVRS